MLVHFLDRQVGMIHDLAGVQHRLCECGKLYAGKAANPRSHQPGRHLIIGNLVVRVSGDEVVDFLAGVFPGIPLFSDQVNGTHAIEGDCETSIGHEARQRDPRNYDLRRTFAALRTPAFFVWAVCLLPALLAARIRMAMGWLGSYSPMFCPSGSLNRDTRPHRCVAGSENSTPLSRSSAIVLSRFAVIRKTSA